MISRIIKVEVGTETLIILDVTKTESNNCFIIHWTNPFFLASTRMFSKFVSTLSFLQVLSFFSLSRSQQTAPLPFCVCESLSSTTFSKFCSVNEANLEVMFLLLHWRQATQNARTWHDYPQKSCTGVIHDMITRDLECPWHDYCITCSPMTSQALISKILCTLSANQKEIVSLMYNNRDKLGRDY